MRDLDQWSLGAGGVLALRWTDGEALPMRETRMPGAETSDLPAEVQAACADLWTPGYVDAWQAEFDPPPGPPGPDELRAAADGIRDRMILAVPVAGGLHVKMDGDARADISGMALAATLASMGMNEWEDGYSRGWITNENVRIPMPLPADGITLAAFLGGRYALISQRNRDVKDAVIAGTVTSLAEIDAAFADVTAPWSPAP